MYMNRNSNFHHSSPVCIGAGLLALDVVLSDISKNCAQFLAGGSCGNVLTILSYLGWQSYPVARLSNNGASELLIDDLKTWKVKDDLLTFTEDGSTPIIIHRILRDKRGVAKHRFEFRNPEDGKYLPSFKPCLASSVPTILEKGIYPKVFYFDRINRASLDLAKEFKEKGSIIFFEPSSLKDEKAFKKCVEVADVIKYSHDRIPDYDSVFPKAQVLLEIETMGENGLRYRKQEFDKWINVHGFAINNVIDTAGAGDWCTAGIISTLFSQGDMHKNLVSDNLLKVAFQYGQILSALNCTYEGARGLMYALNKEKLNNFVSSITQMGTTTIGPHNPVQQKTRKPNFEDVKISSLFN